MTQTYTRTLFHDDLTEAKVELYIYNGLKYDHEEEPIRVTYKNVKAVTIADGEDAEEIEANTDGSCVDENHEYLVLTFADGETSTYRNSHVAMFIW